MQTILDWYVWMPLEAEAFVWPSAMVSGRCPETRAQREHLCLTSVDLVRVRTQTQVAGRREAGMGHTVPYGFVIPQQYL